jgi:glycolate oxidase
MDILSGLPEATVLRDPGDLEPFLRDESHVRGVPPLAVVKPHGPSALRELVRRAKAEGFGLVPRGAGTGKAGGCVPTERTVVVDLSAWPGGIHVSPQDLCLHAPASAPLREVKAAAEAHGLFYPPDPNSWESCALGGTLATNAGGPNACKYGMTRHWVLAVEALLEDGEVHTFGISSVKANAGPALGQLLIGSEGIFGFMVGATLRLTPQPREFTTLLLPVKHWEDLLDLPGRLCSAGFLPSAFEFFDPAVLAELRAHGPEEARRLPGEALAILEEGLHGEHPVPRHAVLAGVGTARVGGQGAAQGAALPGVRIRRIEEPLGFRRRLHLAERRTGRGVEAEVLGRDVDPAGPFR